jgi:hypothetical protein
MKVHDLVLVAKFLRQLEEQAHLQGVIFNALLAFYLGLLELTQGVETACLIDVNLLVRLIALDQFVVHSHCFAANTESVKVR